MFVEGVSTWMTDMVWYFSFFIYLTSLSMTISRSIRAVENGSISFLFYGWVIFHYIYVPYLLYPFICWWTFRLLPGVDFMRLLKLNLLPKPVQNWNHMFITNMSPKFWPGVQELQDAKEGAHHGALPPLLRTCLPHPSSAPLCLPPSPQMLGPPPYHS